MPGNVQFASPSTVLPKIFARQFTRILERPVLISEYRNGEVQTGAQSAGNRGRWVWTGRWTNALRQAFRAFYVARGGPTEPFVMYDPWETDPLFSYDPNGEATVGRHTVRFEGSWQDALELGLGGGSIELVEIT